MARQYPGIHQWKNRQGYVKQFTVNKKRYTVYGDTPAECIRKEIELRKSIEENRYIENTNITLDKLFEEWLLEKAGNLKGNAVRLYKGVYNTKISPRVGKKRVATIEPREIIEFRRAISKNTATNTIRKCMNILSQLFDFSILLRIRIDNPCEYLPKFRKNQPEKQARDNAHRALT